MQRSNAMKKRLILAVALGAILVLALAWSASALSGRAPSGPSGPDSYSNPLTVNVYLGAGDVPTLDPAYAGDTMSLNVIEQLFIGLVDIDDTTSEIVPELATSWDISPDGRVYAFTLRSNARWTDGRVITAGDVRYGILRTLDPAHPGDYAPLLAVIKNAEAYTNGTVGADQVGVKALDDTHLEVTLEGPTSFALYILALPAARPMPKWAIDAWGNDWTDPAHIVTNGPYRLVEWAAADHITLEKYWQFWAEDQVQIERINGWMYSSSTAWTQYVAGALDTVPVPSGMSLTPEQRAQVHLQPNGCNVYLGVTLSKSPFDELLVRKAFAAATDRQGLVDTLYAGLQQSALTFTPYGIFGHVDGEAEGVGIPYDEMQAQTYLDDAGYPDPSTLPAVTLSYGASAGNQALAEYLRQSWLDTLGVDVTLSPVSSNFITKINNGDLQLWRLGWCADYPDAYNFLHDGLEPRSKFGGWSSATYDDLLDQALNEPDPDARKALYKQAEEILVETDAVVIPLFDGTGVIATKPTLERTYPVSGQPDVASWRIRTAETIEPEDGGTLTSYQGDTVIEIPANAIEDTVMITVSSISRVKSGGSLTGIGHLFDVTAVIAASGEPAVLKSGETYNVTVHYTDAERGPVKENTLALYSLVGDEWVKETTSVVEGSANTVSATPNHFSLWAVLGETNRTFLPLVLRF
jgi:oligopeptide transport system substrate-binding protein